jgi:hypothetical protein
VNGNDLIFEKGVGIFVKTALSLPDSFPHVVAVALHGVKHVILFQTEQRIKTLTRWESRPDLPAFDRLVADRGVLFPSGCGLNALLGETLVDLGFSQTLDYRAHSPVILQTLKAKLETEHRGKLLMTEGRAFWTELGLTGYIPDSLKQVLSKLSFECARIVILLFADALCWSSLKRPSRDCPFCKLKFTMARFFPCLKFFIQESAWKILVNLCRRESWEDLVDFIFETLRTWVDETPLFRASFRLHMVKYVNLCTDVTHAAFRWNFV